MGRRDATTALKGSGLPDGAECGSALVFALLVMSALMAFGLAFLEIGVSHSAVGGRSLERLKALTYAEAGLAHGKDELAQNSGFSGTLTYTFADGSYSARVQQSAGTIDVYSEGTAGTTTMGYHSRWTTTSVLDVTRTFLIGAKVNVTNTNLSWSGVFQHWQNLTQDGGSTLTGTLVQSNDFYMFGIDFSGAAASADMVLAPGATLAPGSYTGILYCPGDLTIEGPVDITGTIYVDGTLTVNGNGGDVSLLAKDQSAVLHTKFALVMQNINKLTIVGLLAIRNSCDFKTVGVLDALGSVLVGTTITFSDVQGNWTFDPTVQESPPPDVTGGHRRGLTRESFCRPYVP